MSGALPSCNWGLNAAVAVILLHRSTVAFILHFHQVDLTSHLFLDINVWACLFQAKQ